MSSGLHTIRKYGASPLVLEINGTKFEVPKEAKTVFFEYFDFNDLKTGNVYFKTSEEEGIKPPYRGLELNLLREIEIQYSRQSQEPLIQSTTNTI